MGNIEKYNSVFQKVLSIGGDELNENLIYQSVDSWDSVGHMELIAGLEDVFEINLEMDDVIDFSSYVKGQEILRRYKIDLP